VPQVILPILPGYMWVNETLVSTGISSKPTQHVNPRTGEPCYYVKPATWCCGAYIPVVGLKKYIYSLTHGDLSRSSPPSSS
jgi:hypothetical protein